MNLVIGYIGNAYAGKDTTSNIIAQEVLHCLQKPIVPQEIQDPRTLVKGTRVEINSDTLVIWHTPLALEVKREYVSENPGVVLEKLLYDAAYKSQHREGLIRIGDGRRELVDPLYWIKKVQTTIEHILQEYADSKHHIFNITDMRYENELPHFETYCYEKDIPILSCKLATDLAVILRRMPAKDAVRFIRKHKNNQSEKNVKRVHADIEINNNGNIEQLTAQIKDRVIPIIQTVLFEDTGNN